MDCDDDATLNGTDASGASGACGPDGEAPAGGSASQAASSRQNGDLRTDVFKSGLRRYTGAAGEPGGRPGLSNSLSRMPIPPDQPAESAPGR